MQRIGRGNLEIRSRKMCSVPQCSSYGTSDISLHKFPSNPKAVKKWQTILKIGKPISKFMFVCSKHFLKDDFFAATAETAYDVLSPGPSLKRIAMAKKKKKRYSQPQDIREGVANALSIVRDGIGDTASNLVQVATYEKEQKGYSGAVGGVLREIPSTFVKPILVVAGATSDILGGVRNQLVPDARREANEKWRTDFE